MTDDKTAYIPQSTVKEEFNLTDSLLKLLGEPDKTKPNPHYLSAPPMRLYERSRIERWVAEHADLIEKARERSASARRAAAPRVRAREQAEAAAAAAEYEALVRAARSRLVDEGSQDIRAKLAPMLGQRATFTATVDRLNFGNFNEHVLLRDIKDLAGTVLSDHMWFGASFAGVALNIGAVVRFDADVDIYAKGYRGDREDVHDAPHPTVDYHLCRLTNVSIISEAAPAQADQTAS